MNTLTEIQDAAKVANAIESIEHLSEYGNTFTAYFEDDESVEAFYAFLPIGLTTGETKGPKYTRISVTF
jgi:hypothetical protein